MVPTLREYLDWRGGVPAVRMILQFELPDDLDAADTAYHAAQWRSMCEGIVGRLRERRKYGELPDEVQAEMDALWEWIHEELRERGLSL